MNSKVLFVTTLLFTTTPCLAQVYAGYPDIPAEAIASGTSVINYTPGPGVVSPENTPSYALGNPNDQATSLGRGGSIVVTMAPMALIGDTTSAADFYVYEYKVYNSWDTYVSSDNKTWLKIAPVSSEENNTGTVKGYDVDSLGASPYPYIKLIDTSNESGASSAGADIDGIVIASAKQSAEYNIVDTDTRNGKVFNLEQEKTSGAVDVKIIDKANGVIHVPFTTDDSLSPVALSVQGNFDCDDEKDLNILAVRKSDGVAVNIIKDMSGNAIGTIDNSVIN